MAASRVRKTGQRYAWDARGRATVGRVHNFYGNVGVLVRAYAYIRTLGRAGLERASKTAIINANYLKRKLEATYPVPFDDHCMHEFVISLKALKAQGINPDKLPAKPPDKARRLLTALSYLRTIYTVERRIRGRPPDERYDVRQKEIRPVLERLHAWSRHSGCSRPRGGARASG